MSERKKPIPVPPGGFKSHEDEAQWLADTIATRAGEAVAAVIGISATFPTDSLYDLLLMGLQSAGKRSAAEAQEALSEIEQTFDLRWQADQRAIKRWREESPEERKLTMPDRTDLVVWLLAQHAREVERRREAEATIDDMIVSATRYCIGRMSYIVGSCDGWLRKWWPHLGAGTRDVILRDIQAALEQERLGRRSLGHQIDIDTWAALYRDFSPGGKDHVTPFDRQGGPPNA